MISQLPKADTGAILEALEAEEGRLAPKKRRAVNSALACFAEHGYAATSTRQIAEHAGIAEATIFRHFGTKQKLLLRISQPVMARMLAPAVVAQAQELLEAHPDDPRGFFTGLIRSRLAFVDMHQPFIRILLQETLINPDLRKMLADILIPQVPAVLMPAISDYSKAGLLRAIDPIRLLRVGVPAFMGLYLHRMAKGRDAGWNDEEEIAATVDVLLGGLVPR